MATLTIASKKTSTKPYTVKGATLADIQKEIDKKGPKDGSKNVAGLCTCSLEMDAKSTAIDFNVTQNNKGEYEAEAYFTKGTLNWPCTITMPKCSSVSKLSKPAQKEWKRYMGCLETHETAHVPEYEKEIKAIAAEIEALRGNATNADENKAKKAAFDALAKTFTTDYSQAKNDARLEANAEAYDKKTKHGKTQGAVLDTSIT